MCRDFVIRMALFTIAHSLEVNINGSNGRLYHPDEESDHFMDRNIPIKYFKKVGLEDFRIHIV